MRIKDFIKRLFRKEDGDMVLLGHLQVCEDVMTSVYHNRRIDKYYLSIRLFQFDDKEKYLILDVSPDDILKHMNGDIGLLYFTMNRKGYLYDHTEHISLKTENMVPISNEECRELFYDSSVENRFNKDFAYKSVSLKQYLINLLN